MDMQFEKILASDCVGSWKIEEQSTGVQEVVRCRLGSRTIQGAYSSIARLQWLLSRAKGLVDMVACWTRDADDGNCSSARGGGQGIYCWIAVKSSRKFRNATLMP